MRLKISLNDIYSNQLISNLLIQTIKAINHSNIPDLKDLVYKKKISV